MIGLRQSSQVSSIFASRILRARLLGPETYAEQYCHRNCADWRYTKEPHRVQWKRPKARTPNPSYTNYGHNRDYFRTPGHRAINYFFAVLFFAVFGYFGPWREAFEIIFPKAEAATIEFSDGSVKEKDEAESESDGEKEGEDEGEEKKPRKKKKRVGFRDRKVIDYEDRLRLYSTPDKIFRYFATLKVYPDLSDALHFEVYMTPEDFVRSITPGVMQPEGLGLDEYKKFNPKTTVLDGDFDYNSRSIFRKMGNHLISFTDYIFLLTVLSTSPRHFAIAFKMFDLNGDGELDIEEFELVENIIRSMTTIGARHRDHSNTGSTVKGMKRSALSVYFFGENGDKKLTIDKFLNFQEQLNNDILWIEFNRRDPDENGLISEADFAEMLLMHADLPDKKQRRMLRRVRKMCKHEDDFRQGISFEEVLRFFHFLNHITDIETALTFYHMAGASVDPPTLKQVGRTVAGVDISDHVITTVFTLFDENQDGELSNKEFVSVMKRRLMRGLERPKDTGFVRRLMALAKCGIEQTPAQALASRIR